METSSKLKEKSWALAGILLAAPFFLPALMAMSGILMPVSGLLFIWLAWHQKKHIQILAFISNLFILYSAAAPDIILSVLPVWFSLAFIFRTLLRTKRGVPTSFLITIACSLILYAFEFLILKNNFQVSVLQWIATQTELSIKAAAGVPDSWIKKSVDELGKDTVIQQVVRESPAVFLMVLISSMWSTLWLASKWLRGFLSKSFWSTVRFPFWFVWITLLSGAASLFLKGHAEWLGATCLKGALTIHAIQGLSILTFLFNRMQLKGLIRWIMGLILVLGATPILVAGGFFDQWFDFRRRMAL